MTTKKAKKRSDYEIMKEACKLDPQIMAGLASCKEQLSFGVKILRMLKKTALVGAAKKDLALIEKKEKILKEAQKYASSLFKTCKHIEAFANALAEECK